MRVWDDGVPGVSEATQLRRRRRQGDGVEHAAPVLHGMWREQQEEMFARTRYTDDTTGRTLILEFDMSFSCVRSAEHSTASCVDAETGLVLWKAVFSEGEASTRERLACREGLEFFKSTGIDVGAMVIDDSNCRVIIEATRRVQAATEAQRRQFIKVLRPASISPGRISSDR